MDNEQYAFVLGALARLDRKIDFLIKLAPTSVGKPGETDEDEEFDL